MKLDRKLGIGVRVGFIATAVVCYFGTLFTLAYQPELQDVAAEVFDSLEWLIGAIAIAVGGDTLRPSGSARGAFAVAKEPTS